MFFFEKKNQKTFICLVPRKLFAAGRVIEAQDEAFFSSFFKKYLLWPAAL
jgi:hypothetical protein